MRHGVHERFMMADGGFGKGEHGRAVNQFARAVSDHQQAWSAFRRADRRRDVRFIKRNTLQKTRDTIRGRKQFRVVVS